MINNPLNTLNKSLASPLLKRQRKRNADIKLDYGTTTVGFIYKGGIVLCADSRITQGNVILSKSVLKAMPVSNHIMGMLAGGAADCSFWIRTLAWESCLHERKYAEPLSLLSAATIISNVAMEEKANGRSLWMGVILAGRDRSGPALLRIDGDGYIHRGTAFAVGSGSARALGILDNGFDQNLTHKQAFDLGLRAVYQAALANAEIGCSVSLHHMAKSVWKTVATIDCRELHKNFTRGLNYAGEEIEVESPPSKRLRSSAKYGKSLAFKRLKMT